MLMVMDSIDTAQFHQTRNKNNQTINDTDSLQCANESKHTHHSTLQGKQKKQKQKYKKQK